MTIFYQSKAKYSITFSLLLSLFGALIWIGGLSITNQVDAADNSTDELTILTYEIDRSNVPELTYNELTVLVNVGQTDSIQITGDGSVVGHTYDAAKGIVQFSTAASSIEISVNNPVTNESFGTFEKARLLDGKDFAWSIGMDDNVGLKPSVELLESYGWRGTLFLIARDIQDTRDEDWIMDAPYLRSKLDSGWALGNHTWDHSCDSTVSSQNILDGYNRLQSIVEASTRPDYKIISFAAPCFTPQYHPVIIEQRNQQDWPVQFNESGYWTPLIIDPGVTEDLYSPDDGRFLAYAFDFDEPVGRATDLEILDPQAVIDQIDWMAMRNDTYGDHHWHNVIVHSDKEDVINTVASYAYNAYGPGGTNRIWVAPSDEIYSYLLVRDNTIVRRTGEVNNTPTATPTPINTVVAVTTATSTATSTPIEEPTTVQTATPTFTATNTPAGTAQPTGTSDVEPTQTTATNTPTNTSPALSMTASATPTTTPTATQTSPFSSTVTPTPTATQQSVRPFPSPMTTTLPSDNATAVPTSTFPLPGRQSGTLLYLPLISDSAMR